MLNNPNNGKPPRVLRLHDNVLHCGGFCWRCPDRCDIVHPSGFPGLLLVASFPECRANLHDDVLMHLSVLIEPSLHVVSTSAIHLAPFHPNKLVSSVASESGVDESSHCSARFWCSLESIIRTALNKSGYGMSFDKSRTTAYAVADPVKSSNNEVA